MVAAKLRTALMNVFAVKKLIRWWKHASPLFQMVILIVLHSASLNTQDFSPFVLISMSSAQHGHSINSNIEMPMRGQSTNSFATLLIDSLQDGAGEFWVKRCQSTFHPVQLCAYEHTSLPLDLKKTLNLKDFIMLMNDLIIIYCNSKKCGFVSK